MAIVFCGSVSKYCVRASSYFFGLFNDVYFCLVYVLLYLFPLFRYGGCFVSYCPLGTAKGSEHDDAG